MALFGRLTRFLIALVFFGAGYAVAQFANGNRELVTVSITPYSFRAPAYLLALAPLAAGLALGWLYTVPARTHEFAGHWRSWRALRLVEKENRELRRSLDSLLELPDESSAVPAGEPVAAAPLPAPAADAAPAVSLRVQPARSAGKPRGTASTRSNGRGGRRSAPATAPAS